MRLEFVKLLKIGIALYNKNGTTDTSKICFGQFIGSRKPTIMIPETRDSPKTVLSIEYLNVDAI